MNIEEILKIIPEYVDPEKDMSSVPHSNQQHFEWWAYGANSYREKLIERLKNWQQNKETFSDALTFTNNKK